MKRYITAGAGSGKTYKITTEVARRIKDEGLKPEQVIMTTFTKAAAQELREKAKKELTNLGLFKEAQQMEHALIGTVHSVANTFLTKYWYLLGIMPDACALEEDEIQTFRDQSLRGLLDDKDRKFLYSYCERYNIGYSFTDHTPGHSGLNYSFWKEDLCKVLDYMQWYSITDSQLDISLKDTTESIIQLLEPQPGIDIDNPPSSIKSVHSDLLSVVNAAKKSQKKDNQLTFLNSVKFDTLTTDDLDEFVSIIKDRKLETTEAKEFTEWISEVILFPEKIAEDHRTYAETIFRLAKRWRSDYRSFKDEHHLIDFNDMEEMLLKLLDIPVVRDDIRSRFSCIYVDEFQDSNPIQVRIFQKLSEVIDACYVGDKKQAIYGFRGSDTELTTAVADSIKDKSTLPNSYRSIEPLVSLSNAIFTRVFDGMDDVTLTMPDDKTKGNRDKVDKPMRLWSWNNDADLALQIQQFILRENIDCKEIAVLARNNSDLDSLAAELRALGVPVCREDDNIKDTRTGRLIKALLTLMTTPGNLLARAEAAYLTEPGFNLTRIIEERLDNISNAEQADKEYLEQLPIISRLSTLRPEIKAQSISAMLETLIIELNLYNIVRRWENAEAEETNLQVLVDLAKQYEQSATKLARAATVAGFIDYFCNQQQKSAADNTGVRLFTYHKSKGLEWKVVIMLSLDNNVNDEGKLAKRSFLGCHTHRSELPTAENPNPAMTISLVRNIYTTTSNEKFPPAVLARLQEHPLWDVVRDAEKRESARLLYVGVTRARNILILASKSKEGNINLNWFRSAGLEDVCQTVTGDHEQDILGLGIPFFIENVDIEKLLEWPQTESTDVFDIARDFSSLDSIRGISPSKAGKIPHELGKVINDKEYRIPETVKKEQYAQMGDFIHQVFCRMDDGISLDEIKALRDSYGLTSKNMPEPGRLQDAWNNLTKSLEAEYGPSINRIHEMPFSHIDGGGHFITGYIDFIWETADSYVVVDYKTCPGNYSLVFKTDSEHYAGCHGDQLDCYQRAIEANGGKKVKARVIYYPVTGFIIEVK